MQQTSPVRPHALTPKQLAVRVQHLIASPAQWVARVRLDLEGRWYERLHTDDRHDVWLITWMPGQSTSFHDHGGSNGAFGVVWGDLDECVVSRDCGAVLVNRLAPGIARSFGPRHVHDVRNSSASSVAVSVHAYSPPLFETRRYDVTPAGLVLSGTETAENW